jgi:uncharacterized SAM-binding protein YcdF (DUF218 family)
MQGSPSGEGFLAASVLRITVMPSPVRKRFRALWWLLAALLAILLCVLRWGSNLLIVSEPAPDHMDAAIVLQGSVVAEKVRIAGAVGLLHRGLADRVLLSVPRESYWGQSVPPLAHAFIERNYGTDAAARTDFCETGAEVNSTLEEAQALSACIQDHHWRAVAIVTSDYHTRRAGMLWRRALKERNAGVHIWIDGVADPEFQQPWWRHRQSAKIWLMESLKLGSSIL